MQRATGIPGIGRRLEEALGRWPEPPGGKRDKKTFAAAMEARLRGRGGQKGVSYQSILSYFDGSSTPSLEWLQEAAHLLDVRPEWLVFGLGAPDQSSEAVRLAHEERARQVEGSDLSNPLAQAALEGLTETLPLQEHLDLEYGALIAVAIGLARAHTERGSHSGIEAYREAGRTVGQVVAGPLRSLRASFPENEGRLARAYVSAVAHALGLIGPYANREGRA